ncbi:MAG: glycosyltransferase, partial [Pseudomonadota bacterium]
MRIAVTRTQVPFVHGGAERHADRLVQALNAYGYDATVISVPFKWYPVETFADSIVAAKLLDLSEVDHVPVDMMIGLKFPAWLAQHPNPVFWILHQHRQVFDYWCVGDSTIPDDDQGLAIKQMVEQTDRAAFARSQRPLYANSHNVAQRLKTHLDLEATPLYHPPPLAGQLETMGDNGAIFAPGRINPTKRVDLLLRALAKTPGSVRLRIAGLPERPDYLQTLHQLASDLGVAARVDWLGGISDAQLLREYGEARAVAFTPSDEDYGYITLEAMLAGKPVITTTDAGGPLEFLRDGQEGRITAPDPAAIGAAMTELSEDGARAARLGQAGRARYESFDIRWDHVVETLTGAPAMAQPGPVAAAASQAPIPSHTPSPAPEPVAEADAVAKLRAAIQPPTPPSIPFASVAEVLEAYDFSTLPPAGDGTPPPEDTGLASYLETHWTRYLTTLRHVVDLAPTDILDVGIFPPLVFEAMILGALPQARLAGVWEGPHPYHQDIRARSAAHPDFALEIRPANIERDALPYDAQSFDLVLGMEIFEHLALDPHFFLRQAARVLRPGGHVLLTTPNIISHSGIEKAFQGRAPYSFGRFVPTGGVYGRHNREYAPREVEALGQAAGFETHYLGTADVYDLEIDPGTAAMLAARESDLSLRGENIVYVGRKAHGAGPVPEGVYHGDPVAMEGRLSAEQDATGLARVTAHNRAPVTWPSEGGHATLLHAQWVNPQGGLVYTGAYLALPGPVGPGEAATLSLALSPEGTEDAGTLMLDLFQSGV